MYYSTRNMDGIIVLWYNKKLIRTISNHTSGAILAYFKPLLK